MKTNKLLVAVLVLQALTLAGQWAGNASYVGEARAEVMDPSAQRVAQTEELKGINQKLDRLVGLLESGRVEVKVGNISDLKAANGNANANAKR